MISSNKLNLTSSDGSNGGRPTKKKYPCCTIEPKSLKQGHVQINPNCFHIRVEKVLISYHELVSMKKLKDQYIFF